MNKEDLSTRVRNEATYITVVTKKGAVTIGQDTNGVDRKTMAQCYYTLENGTEVDALLREKRDNHA